MKILYTFLIKQYQKRISPHKGYRCAYSLEHGGPGCSGAVLEILESKGFFGGISDIRERFLSCKISAEERDRRKEDRKRRREDNGSNCLDAVCVPDISDCIPRCRGPKSCDTPSCDLPTPDCIGIGFLSRFSKK